MVESGQVATPCQGWLLFHNAEHGEEFLGLSGKFAEGRGDVFASLAMEEPDRRIAKGGQDLRGGMRTHSALVFAEGLVTHVMQRVFDAPVTTPPSQQLRGVSLISGNAGDSVLDFDCLLPLATGRANQPADLCQTWPVRVAGQASRRLQATPNDSPMLLLDRFSNVLLRKSRRFVRRGKKPPETRRQCRLAAWVGCLSQPRSSGLFYRGFPDRLPAGRT